MSNLFFWIVFLTKINSILQMFIGLLWLITITCIIITIIGYTTKFCYITSGKKDIDYKKGKVLVKIFKKPTILLLSITIIFSILSICIPSDKQILTYYILKNIDEYNIKNKESNFNPNKILENVDNTIIKIQKMSDTILDKLDSNSSTE